MKRIFSLLFIVLSAASCQTTYPEIEDDPTKTGSYAQNALVLNSGNWNSNDASLTRYTFTTKLAEADVFKTTNGVNLGDLAEDIIIFGSKAYISVSNSGVIFVIDKYSCKVTGKIAASLDGGSSLSPRRFTTCGKDVFVSYYEGFVGQIDTTSLQVKKLISVGANPEGIAASNGKIYVANSGGLSYPNYGKTVSVIDFATLNVINSIEVVENPMEVVSDPEGEIYVISYGNYSDVPSKLQRIDPSSGEVTPVESVSNPMKMSVGYQGVLAIVTSDGKILRYDTSSSSESLLGDFVIDGAVVNNAYSVSADPVSGYVLVGCSDYVSTGKVYVFSKEGTTYDSFSSGGLNPQKVAFNSLTE